MNITKKKTLRVTRDRKGEDTVVRTPRGSRVNAALTESNKNIRNISRDPQTNKKAKLPFIGSRQLSSNSSIVEPNSSSSILQNEERTHGKYIAANAIALGVGVASIYLVRAIVSFIVLLGIVVSPFTHLLINATLYLLFVLIASRFVYLCVKELFCTQVLYLHRSSFREYFQTLEKSIEKEPGYKTAQMVGIFAACLVLLVLIYNFYSFLVGSLFP